MYTPITLINEELFKLHSPITGNTDLTEFVPYLSIAQELYIAPLLGESLMSELKLQISQNSLNESNSNLDDLESKAPVGSSASISDGSVTNALADATLCFCPPDI